MKKAITYVLLTILLLAGCTQGKSLSRAIPEPEYWPTTGWQSSTPEAQGMDSGQLARMLGDISSAEMSIHSVLVIRNGYMVTEAYFHPYTRDTKMHIQSVTKSVIGMLVGKAISERHIESEDERLVSFYQDRSYQRQGNGKDSIRLKHLLSMSSGLDCQEFSSSGTSMEQTQDWVQFMLDRPMAAAPGQVFGYCNGNAHLLSAILEKSTGVSTREYANGKLFQPLGIPRVNAADWGSDPQHITIAGYGLHLRPVDMAKLALLYLNNGKWEDQQIIPAEWVANSTTEHVQKEDGSGYGYLWTVYPQSDHYAALGLGGQQIHVYPARNLIVIVTASLESLAEAPEIEKMLNEYILPAVRSEDPLADDPGGFSHLQTRIEAAANPVRPIAALPPTALDISESIYEFGDNSLGWQTLQFVFGSGKAAVEIVLNGSPVQAGLDNIYRSSNTPPGGEILLRGQWVDDETFVLDYPYPLAGATALGELGESQFQFKFSGDELDVTVEQLVFGGEPYHLHGSR
jgi:CubicO group peptidase (beta-lactamase class C family)